MKLRLPVKENIIMIDGKSLYISLKIICIMPNQFISKIILAKNIIHYNFYIMDDMPVQMNIYRSLF